jgi:hypothetical protein
MRKMMMPANMANRWKLAFPVWILAYQAAQPEGDRTETDHQRDHHALFTHGVELCAQPAEWTFERPGIQFIDAPAFRQQTLGHRHGRAIAIQCWSDGEGGLLAVGPGYQMWPAPSAVVMPMSVHSTAADKVKAGGTHGLPRWTGSASSPRGRRTGAAGSAGHPPRSARPAPSMGTVITWRAFMRMRRPR